LSKCNVCGAPIFSDEEVHDQPCLDCIWDGNVKPTVDLPTWTTARIFVLLLPVALAIIAAAVLL
jgi:hypothetical protein